MPINIFTCAAIFLGRSNIKDSLNSQERNVPSSSNFIEAILKRLEPPKLSFLKYFLHYKANKNIVN